MVSLLLTSAVLTVLGMHLAAAAVTALILAPLARLARADLAESIGTLFCLALLGVVTGFLVANAYDADDELVGKMVDWSTSRARAMGGRIQVRSVVQCCMTSGRSSAKPSSAVRHRSHHAPPGDGQDRLAQPVHLLAAM
jgi:hypothetical protein